MLSAQLIIFMLGKSCWHKLSKPQLNKWTAYTKCVICLSFFLVACTQPNKPLCWSVDPLVQWSVGPSVADCSENATYRNWPCLNSV